RPCRRCFLLSAGPNSFGFLACPECNQIIVEISVATWNDWILDNVKRKRALKDRSYWKTNPEKCSSDGLGAELAACLSLCPGHLGDWMARTRNLKEPNPGRDLLGTWIGYDKDFEIKSTSHYDEVDKGIMFIR